MGMLGFPAGIAAMAMASSASSAAPEPGAPADSAAQTASARAPGGEEAPRPILPGLPGYDPANPSWEVVAEIDRLVARLSREWYRYPKLDQASRHRGVSLLEAMEYHLIVPFLQACADALRPPSGAPPEAGS
jgi:hypothetical protein